MKPEKGMKGSGILMLLGRGKPSDDDDSSEDSSPKGGPARAYAKEAFSAIKDDDEAGFIEAFLGAVEACASKKTTDDED